jgi:hypothetical protein
MNACFLSESVTVTRWASGLAQDLRDASCVMYANQWITFVSRAHDSEITSLSVIDSPWTGVVTSRQSHGRIQWIRFVLPDSGVLNTVNPMDSGQVIAQIARALGPHA